MNLQSFKIARNCTKIALFLICYVTQVSVKAWDVDLSRREKELQKSQTVGTVVDQPSPTETVVLKNFFDNVEPSQEIVIMNTDKGFVPETVRLKKGGNYKIHVVNVNNVEKNTSFVLDAFSEHHATFFGQEKSFSLTPKTEGIFSFQCPETAKQGRLIIMTDGEATRKPANSN